MWRNRKKQWCTSTTHTRHTIYSEFGECWTERTRFDKGNSHFQINILISSIAYGGDEVTILTTCKYLISWLNLRFGFGPTNSFFTNWKKKMFDSKWVSNVISGTITTHVMHSVQVVQSEEWILLIIISFVWVAFNGLSHSIIIHYVNSSSSHFILSLCIIVCIVEMCLHLWHMADISSPVAFIDFSFL